jgi:hypothetical protein
MRYFIFQDLTTKTFHPVFFSSHLDPSKIKIEGMQLNSGGDLNISPDARFSVQPSEFYRSDADDHQFVGAAIGGLDEPEFKRKKPVLLFKLSNESLMRKAYSIAELFEVPGFPENVSWVSNASGTPAFDRFFEVTENGISIKKSKQQEGVEDASNEYFGLILKTDPSGVVGNLGFDGKIYSYKKENIGETGDPQEDTLIWMYSSLTGGVYWLSDPGEAAFNLVSEYLSKKGYKVSKNATIQFSGTQSEESEPVSQLKKPKSRPAKQ